MKLSVYLSETMIQAVLGRVLKGRLEIKSVYSRALREGTLINDMITDEAYLKDAAGSIRERYPEHKHHIHLVVGGRAVTKVVQIPGMSRRQALALTRRELMDYSQCQEDMIYDYGVIRDGKNKECKTILCAGLERKVVDSYKSLFLDCGMKVKSLGIAQGSLVHLGEMIPVLQERTFILTVLSGRNLMSTLYVDGLYTYTSRIRLLPESTVREYAGEISESINAIVKFYNMRGMEGCIDSLFVCGLDEGNEDECLSFLADNTGLSVSRLPEEKMACGGKEEVFPLGNYLFAAGNLIGR